MDEEEIIDPSEIEFHGFIRTQIVCLLLFIVLYTISFWIIQYFKTRTDSDELYAGDEDFFVYRISVWMCTFSLSVSIGAVTLLPFSVLGSEVLHTYPDNFYLKWLNWSLINSLWNYVFLLSNVSLFFLLPFAYFFIESQGFSFQQRPKPFLARIYETICVCALVIVILVGLAHVFYSLFLSEKLSVNFSLFNLSGLSVPLVYSFVSLAGVFLLLLSTPLGFAKMFDITSKLLVNEHAEARHETTSASGASTTLLTNSTSEPNLSRTNHLCQSPMMSAGSFEGSPLTGMRYRLATGPSGDSARVHSMSSISKRLHLPALNRTLTRPVSRVQHILKASRYPLAILVLLLLTAISVSMVLINTLQLLFGFRMLPEYVQFVEVHSRHTFGIAGAIVENVIIVYIMVAALVGVYSIPLLSRMRPSKGATSMTCVIANCATILLLSSALPVLARTLGITSFDLLGSYGSINWISNFSLVWSYNVLFAAASTFSLINKFTLQARVELMKRLRSVYKEKRVSTNDKKST